MAKMLVLDGNSLLYRAYFALPALTGPEGQPTGALTGFCNMLLRLIKEQQPTHILAAFDAHGPTFRHELYEGYKAGRPPTPEDLRAQFDLLKDGLHAMGIATAEQLGIEADDWLGSAAAFCDQQKIPCMLVTGDRDALQLISDNTVVAMMKQGGRSTVYYTPAVLFEEYGLQPKGIIDLKALMGDTSDKIPGVPGVGEKTALKLLAEHGSLEQLYQNADAIPGKLGEKLRDNRSLAMLSYKLATINCTLPLQPLEQLAWSGYTAQGVAWARSLGMNSIAGKMQPLLQDETTQPAMPQIQPTDCPLDQWPRLLQNAQRVALWQEGERWQAYDGQQFLQAEAQEHTGSVQISLLEAVQDESPQNPISQLAFLAPKDLIVWRKQPLFDAAYAAGLIEQDGLLPFEQAEDLSLAAYVADSVQDFANPAAVLARWGGEASAPGLWQAMENLRQHLQNIPNAWELYADVERPLAGILWRMQHQGMLVDRTVLKDYGTQLANQMQQLTQQIYQLTGCEFNIASPRQLGEVLFEKLKLPAGRKTKSGYSTDVSVLEGLVDRHPAIAVILQLRQTQKIYGTYIEGLLAACDSQGFVHTTFDQTATATGRLSSAAPNLQNIPVRTEMGRQIRRAFVPRKPGWQLVSADYSQLELRILADYARDPAFVRAFEQGLDIHRSTAAEVNHLPESQVTPQMRSAAKAVNFGIVYGISDFGLARQLNISRQEAGDYIRRYFEHYTGIRQYMDQIAQQATEQGGVFTRFGRWRTIAELRSAQHHVRQFGQRAAQNTPIQGTAADIIKIAMVQVYRAMRQAGLKAQLVLQVHDELIVDCPAEEVQAVCSLLQQHMQQAASLAVPLEVDLHTGDNWAAAK